MEPSQEAYVVAVERRGQSYGFLFPRDRWADVLSRMLDYVADDDLDFAIDDALAVREAWKRIEARIDQE